MTSNYVRNSIERATLMADALKAGPCTLVHLAEISGLSKIAVTRWLKSVRDSVYISGYTLDARGRLFTVQWSWGRRKDAPRPGPQTTPAERMRAVRLRRKGVQSGDDLFA